MLFPCIFKMEISWISLSIVMASTVEETLEGTSTIVGWNSVEWRGKFST